MNPMKKQDLKALIRHNDEEVLDDLVDNIDQQDQVRTRRIRNSKPKHVKYEADKEKRDKDRAAQRKLKHSAGGDDGHTDST
jgi:hypothetical protein